MSASRNAVFSLILVEFPPFLYRAFLEIDTSESLTLVALLARHSFNSTMVSTKVSSVLLVQIASLFAGAAARCVRACPASDSLLVLLRNEDAIPFCIDFLNIPVSQVEVTVTPTIISSTTATSYITEFVSDISTSTATVTSSVRYSIIQDKRAVPVYPEWLPVTYGERRVSSACHCLSISAPVVTSAVTADAVTSTATTTVTDQITSTIHSTVIATQTVAPPKPISNRQVGIEVLVASTESPGALVSKGWLHMSGGDAQVLKNPPEQTFKFTVPPGATSAERVRITHPYISAGNALGVSTYSNIEYDV